MNNWPYPDDVAWHPGRRSLVALQMLALLKRGECPASQLFNAFTPSPQKLENLLGLDPALLQDEAVLADLRN